MASPGERRATAIDFATYSPDDSAQEEIQTTIRELCEAFGPDTIVSAVSSYTKRELRGDASHAVATALRALCTLVSESDRPRLTVALVGKLVGMETVTGKRIALSALAGANGISKQAVSNRMKLYAERLNLPRPDQTDAARLSSRLTNRRNYGKRTT